MNKQEIIEKCEEIHSFTTNVCQATWLKTCCTVRQSESGECEYIVRLVKDEKNFILWDISKDHSCHKHYFHNGKKSAPIFLSDNKDFKIAVCEFENDLLKEIKIKFPKISSSAYDSMIRGVTDMKKDIIEKDKFSNALKQSVNINVSAAKITASTK